MVVKKIDRIKKFLTKSKEGSMNHVYYCLGEYCESRNLAVDPCRLPLSEQFTDEEKAEIIEALTKDNPLYDDMDDRPAAREPCGSV